MAVGEKLEVQFVIELRDALSVAGFSVAECSSFRSSAVPAGS